METDSDPAIDRLRKMLERCRHGVVFTGAGVSTESGIPDYRSPGGVWDKFKPVEFHDFLASEEMRREYWRRKFATHDVVAGAEPNRGHRAIAALVGRGRVISVITQNVDGLHQKSGVPEDRVIELHGNTTYARCLECAERHEIVPLRVRFLADGTLPVCRRCGGIVKTATISFGQAMPEDEMRRAEKETRASDLFLAIGTSLVVYPAAAFPMLAKDNGARLVILNRDPTDFDRFADLVIKHEIGPALGAAAGVD